MGSVSGNVSIESGNKTEIGASAVLAGKNISITGENVQISSKDNVYHSDEKHEYRKSGLTVSVGGDTIKALQKVEAPLAKATAVSDNRLKALYGYEAYGTVKSDLKGENSALKDLSSGKVHLAVSVGIGSTSSQSENHSVRTEAQGSTLSAGENVSIQAKSDMEIKGSAVEGENVTWHVGQNLTITSAEETQQQNMTESSKGGSLGVSISAHAPITVEGSLYAGKGKENDTSVSYKESTIQARNELISHSGKDTNLIGSTLSGGKVTMNIGGNMNITSQQASHHYTSENASAGMHVSTLPGKVNLTGNASRGSMRSDFDSVTSQSGIHAGNDGYEITVKENTRLKGGLIDSVANADKNRLTTGTLAWEDMKNSADYKAGGLGISYASKDEGTRLNERGLTPSISPAIRGSADSTTKSAVSEGTITITDREHQKQDISKLNRDTQNSLNQLQEIFDKTKVEEKQELVGMLEKYGNQALHTYAESKGWKDGSTEKMLLHGAFGALMGDMAGGSAATGVLSGSVNEYVIGYLTKTKGEEWIQQNPDTVQWISTGVGATIGASANDLATGAGISLNSSKWNYLGFELPETEHLLEETLIRKDGQELADDESRKVFELIYQTANQGDPYGAASDSELKVGNTIAIAGVTAVLQKHYTKESVDSFLKKYHEMVNSKITDGKINNKITLRPVHVIANRNQNNFDIFLIQYSAGPIEQGYLYDKASDKFYVTNGFTKSDDLHMSLRLGGEAAGIALKTSSSSIDLDNEKTRSDILSGGSIGGTAYAGIGGGISTPTSGKYAGEVLVFKYGVGTPQVGGGWDVAEATSEESVPALIRYLLKENK